MRQIVAEIIREKALYALNEEDPARHRRCDRPDERDRPNGKIVDIDAPSSASAIPQGHHHRKTGRDASRRSEATRYELEQMLEQKVNLEALGKVKKRLERQRFPFVKNFGYDKRNSILYHCHYNKEETCENQSM